MTESQKTSAAKTAWHVVEDLPEIEVAVTLRFT
jgi:hypothetical protein